MFRTTKRMGRNNLVVDQVSPVEIVAKALCAVLEDVTMFWAVKGGRLDIIDVSIAEKCRRFREGTWLELRLVIPGLGFRVQVRGCSSDSSSLV